MLTRRDFLKATVVGGTGLAAMGLAGCSSSSSTESSSIESSSTESSSIESSSTESSSEDSVEESLVEDTGTIITVYKDTEGFEFSDGLYGTNHRFFSYGCGIWDHENQKIYDAWKEIYAESGLKAIRYPGGTCSNYLWWKDTIGPVEDRPSSINSYRQNAGEVAEFGLHEFLDFAEEFNQKVTWVYNASNGNAQDAAELIYYLHGDVNSDNETEAYWANLRKENGREEPYSVQYFELGNEYSFQSSCFSVGEGTGDYEGKTKDEMYATGAELLFTNTPLGLDGDSSTAAAASTGEANQVFVLTYGPDEDGIIEIATGTGITGWYGIEFTADDVVWEQKTEAEVEAAGPNDYVFWLDEDNIHVHFGDGVHGAIPEEGKTIAATYSCWHDGVKQYAEAMRDAAEVCGVEIRVYSCLESETFIQAAADTDYDGIAYHPYLLGVSAKVYPNGDWTEDLNTFHNNSMLAFDVADDTVTHLQGLLDANQGTNEKARDVIITEFTNHSSSGLYYGSMSNTVLTMGNLFDYFEMNLAFALRHSTVDDFFGGSTYAMALYDGGEVDIYEETQTGEFLAEPSAYAYQILDHMTGEYHLDAEVENNLTISLDPDTAITNTSGIETDGTCELVKVLSSIDGDGTVYLIVLNRSVDQNIDVNITVPGYNIAQANVEYIWNEDITAVNTWEDKENVVLTADSVEVNGDSFNYTLPYCSMVGFELVQDK